MTGLIGPFIKGAAASARKSGEIRKLSRQPMSPLPSTSKAITYHSFRPLYFIKENGNVLKLSGKHLQHFFTGIRDEDRGSGHVRTGKAGSSRSGRARQPPLLVHLLMQGWLADQKSF
jgi:hypothetical protein